MFLKDSIESILTSAIDEQKKKTKKTSSTNKRIKSIFAMMKEMLSTIRYMVTTILSSSSKSMIDEQDPAIVSYNIQSMNNLSTVFIHHEELYKSKEINPSVHKEITPQLKKFTNLSPKDIYEEIVSLSQHDAISKGAELIVESLEKLAAIFPSTPTPQAVIEPDESTELHDETSKKEKSKKRKQKSKDVDYEEAYVESVLEKQDMMDETSETVTDQATDKKKKKKQKHSHD